MGRGADPDGRGNRPRRTASVTRQFIHVNDPLPPFEPRGNTLAIPAQLSAGGVGRLVKTEPLPNVVATGRTTAERILSVLLDDRMRLGPSELAEVDRQIWLARIDQFVAAGRPIQFVLMSCPYKMPSLAKTDRVCADVGELLMFRRLAHLAALVGSLHEPGAEVVLLVEGILGRCTEQDLERVAAYQRSLPGLLSMLGADARHLRLFDLGQISNQVEDFDERWAVRAIEIERRLTAGDPPTVLAAANVVPALRTAVPVLDEPTNTVLRAYAEGVTSEDPHVRLLAARIDAAARVAFTRYLGFLELRDESGYLERVAPGAIKLTVSAKRGNIGSIPVNSRTHTLPYHGVPVRLPSGRWSIRYLVDVRSSRHHFQPIHLVSDPDPAPIAYLATR